MLRTIWEQITPRDDRRTDHVRTTGAQITPRDDRGTSPLLAGRDVFLRLANQACSPLAGVGAFPTTLSC